jgi:predicted amidophosphoribosyltransferase
MFMAHTITAACIECGKKLQSDEQETGFCADCNAKIENDMRILRECDGDSFSFLADLAV